MSVCKTKHSKLKESPVEGPREHMEPANSSRHQLTDGENVQKLWTRLHRYGVTTGDSDRRHGMVQTNSPSGWSVGAQVVHKE